MLILENYLIKKFSRENLFIKRRGIKFISFELNVEIYFCVR